MFKVTIVWSDLLTSKTLINLQASKNIFTDWWNELDKYDFLNGQTQFLVIDKKKYNHFANIIM